MSDSVEPGGAMGDGTVADGTVAGDTAADGISADGPTHDTGPDAPAEPGPDGEPDALISRLRVIENQPLETRAAAFTQIYESLQAVLGGAGGADAR